jgi:transcriptional regulator with XRE-family HTH domain
VPRFHPVDIHVGARLRQRRSLVGLSQTKLSESVGLSFRQIKKYERGINRISSSRLYEFAWVLAVPISYFFDEMPARALSGRPLSGYRRKGFRQAVSTFKQKKDLLSKRETLELVRAYEKIDEERVRDSIFEERVRDSIFAAVKALGESGHAKLLTSRRKR